MSASTPSAASRGARFNIGQVLDQLRGDFPGVTIPKIRFLEDQGLVKPERTAAGYRKFSGDDVARLRYILLMQRDHYLPLKVIGEQLDAILPTWFTQGAGVTFYFGGTSLLIVVGVAMDTVNQVESQLIMRHYDGFMKKTRIRGRRG